jgi:hypothetical protein
MRAGKRPLRRIILNFDFEKAVTEMLIGDRGGDESGRERKRRVG